MKLDFKQTEKGIKLIKDTFERKLAKALSLTRVTAPRFLKVGKGLQDDLAGTQVPVRFSTKFSDAIEIVHSLAKWKRFTLGKFGFLPGTGIYTDMDAIRKDEDVSEIHSIYVDQWDWEKVMLPSERSVEFLKKTVKKIYGALLETEEIVFEKLGLSTRLSEEIKFVFTEELEEKWPDLSAKEREDKIASELGAVFLIGIGGPLKSGKPHDLRAADYDDWITDTSTETGMETKGLCGDILVWDPIRKKSLELSSMGIRVSPETMITQLEMTGLEKRKELEFHKGVISGELPLSIGGGIGQSRICMFLLQKRHIGEVQSSVWPEEMITEATAKGVVLL